jgi:hypothetical protein
MMWRPPIQKPLLASPLNLPPNLVSWNTLAVRTSVSLRPSLPSVLKPCSRVQQIESFGADLADALLRILRAVVVMHGFCHFKDPFPRSRGPRLSFGCFSEHLYIGHPH